MMQEIFDDEGEDDGDDDAWEVDKGSIEKRDEKEVISMPTEIGKQWICGEDGDLVGV